MKNKTKGIHRVFSTAVLAMLLLLGGIRADAEELSVTDVKTAKEVDEARIGNNSGAETDDGKPADLAAVEEKKPKTVDADLAAVGDVDKISIDEAYETDPSSESESNESENVANTEMGDIGGEEKEDTVTDGAVSEGGFGEDDSLRADDAPAEDKSSNLFTDIYSAFISHAGVIFSTLSFAVSLILSYGYKRSLLPIIKSSSGTLRAAVKSISEQVSAKDELSMKKISEQSGLISDIKGELEELKAAINETCERLSDGADDRKERERMRVIIEGQIDMLYDIFMTSALPQYKKDDVGTRITAMKEKLNTNE